MQEQIYNVIGVMSGTSLDGVDLAHIRFAVNGSRWRYRLEECQTISYNSEWADTLRSAVTFTDSELQTLNEDYTTLLAHIIKKFIEQNSIADIDAVCSHGHTILHRPKDGVTLQIGNLAKIATLSGQKVVCDFRVQDVKLGGQGAPLVPIGDRLLFSEYKYCLNLGGFSNVSFESDGTRLAFDISPVNTVLNHYARQLGFDYDDSGAIARQGKIDEKLLDELNSLDFYQISAPKSLGFEFVREIVIPLIDQHKIPTQNILRTFVEHVAFQTAKALNNPSGRMLVTGGGAYHTLLIDRMRRLMPNLLIEIPHVKTLEFKEALIFGLLGVLRLRGEVNVLASVTGASADHCSGVVWEAN
jgi:anhydro-N-acetylmuramic acid kinase